MAPHPKSLAGAAAFLLAGVCSCLPKCCSHLPPLVCSWFSAATPATRSSRRTQGRWRRQIKQVGAVPTAAGRRRWTFHGQLKRCSRGGDPVDGHLRPLVDQYRRPRRHRRGRSVLSVGLRWLSTGSARCRRWTSSWSVTSTTSPRPAPCLYAGLRRLYPSGRQDVEDELGHAITRAGISITASARRWFASATLLARSPSINLLRTWFPSKSVVPQGYNTAGLLDLYPSIPVNTKQLAKPAPSDLIRVNMFLLLLPCDSRKTN